MSQKRIANTLFKFDNSYHRLGEAFAQHVEPSPVSSPTLIQFNRSLASSLELTQASPNAELLTQIFSGNALLEGGSYIAQVYAAHQFGNFVPQLGDGRAIQIGEHVTSQNTHFDIQLKGAGITPYSRNGDGRSALGPVIREYVVSEAMHALGIPTTRALAAVTTGESVYRENITPGGVLTRVASSHIRIGTFQYFAARGMKQELKQLADYSIERHYPECLTSDQPYLAFLRQVCDRQAQLIAQWMRVGFIHGVMNTDNMSIAGETIDYGPCAFMEYFDPHMVFSYIDRNGRYAYSQQGHIGQWNLARLAETLLTLIDPDLEQAITLVEPVINDFSRQFKQYWLACMRHKIGLVDAARDEDEALIHDYFDMLEQSRSDFTHSFRTLSSALAQQNPALFLPNNQRKEKTAWYARWNQRVLDQQQSVQAIAAQMDGYNPLYIPRNHWLEAAIQEGEQENAFKLMTELIEVLTQPYTQQQGKERFAKAAEPHERVKQTFCGT